MAGLCCSVNGNQPEGHGITFLPLKIVYKTPMEVAAYGKVIAQTVLNTCESCFDKSNTFLVISGSNSPDGSCTYAVKSYPTYLADEPEWASRAEKVAARMQDLTSFIVNTLGVVDVGASLQGRAVYHPSCSLARKLGVKDEPLMLLKNVRGLELLTFAEQDTCCGFGGTFSVKMAEISGEMVKEKVAHLMEVRPEYLIGADVSCLLNISGRLQREGQKVKVMHIAEVLMSR